MQTFLASTYHRFKPFQRRGSGLALIALTLAAAANMPVAAQQAYPTKPVRLIVNFQAGGPTDILARLVADSLQKELKQPFVVDNKTGAGGNVGADFVAKSQPDGYNVLFSIDTTFTTNPALYPSMPFKADDLKPLMIMTTSGLLFGANAGLGIKSVPEFVAKGKAGNMNFSSAGNGSPGHITMALLAEAAGIKATHIPYKGAAPAVQAIVSGEVDAGILVTPGLMPQVQGGRVTALAVTGQKRSPLLPQVPTVGELGLKSMEFEVLQVAMVPAATPDAVVQLLQAGIVRAMQQPEVKARLTAMDMTVLAETGKTAEARLAANRARYAKVIQATGMKAE
ncbi:MAG: tripartite tricarboxylate transporter substrate binding protein [Pseudomonadota bacterium]